MTITIGTGILNDYIVDGIADDIEIQAAVDAASPGDILKFEAGDYMLDKHILVTTDSLIFEGSGRYCTKLINSYIIEDEINVGNRDVFTIDAKGVRFSRLATETAGWLIGNGIQLWGNCEDIIVEDTYHYLGVDGVSTEYSHNVTLNNVRVEGAEHGIGSSYSTGLHYTNIEVRGTDERVMQRGLAFWGCQDVVATDLKMDKIGTTGIYVRTQGSAVNGQNTDNIRISDFTINDTNSTLDRAVYVEAGRLDPLIKHNTYNIFINRGRVQAYGPLIGDGISVEAKDSTVINTVKFSDIKVYARRNPVNITEYTGGGVKYVDLVSIDAYKTNTSQAGGVQIHNCEKVQISHLNSYAGGGNYNALYIANNNYITVSDSMLQASGTGSALINTGNSNDKVDPDSVITF